jgi:HlyD family type I secretion membrane fusion protein
VAERDETKDIIFPEILLKEADDPEISKILHTQQNLFQYQRDTLASTIEQLHKKLEGLASRKEASAKGYRVMSERVKAGRDLLAKGFMHKAGLHELETKEISYKSDVANTESEIASTEIELNNIKSKNLTNTLRELKDTQIQLSDTRERFNRVKDALDHSTLTSPVDGIVNHIYVNTIGGVVGGGHPIVEISPENDSLVVEARVSPKNIDSVHVGLNAKIRFSAFKSRTTPVFNGKLVALSHDVVTDPNGPAMGQEPVYYAARIEVDMDEFNEVAKARGIKLQPGMQAEVQIVTGERTLLRYLLDPVTDTMFKALKEK